MTVRRLAVLITMLPSVAAAQEPITFADLRGKVIEARIVRAQDIRRGGGRIISVEGRSYWKVAVGPGDMIDTSVTRSITGPRGTRPAAPQRGSFVLDKPRPVPTMGGGHAGWTFGEQSLTFMRTFKSGAMRVTFALARSADGLTCTVSELLAREEGAGPIVLEPGAPGQQVTVVRSRQTGAECAVEKGTGTR